MKKRIFWIILFALLIVALGIFWLAKFNNSEDITIQEHIIVIKSDNAEIKAVTGSFCYDYGLCIDKIAFQDFNYNPIASTYDNKLYIDNLDGTIKSIELYDYVKKEFVDINVSYTNDYIVTPHVGGEYIFKINAIYQGKNIGYYFLANIIDVKS